VTSSSKRPPVWDGRHYVDGEPIVVGRPRYTPARVKRAYLAASGLRQAGESLGISGQRVIQIMREHYPELIRPRGGGRS
jgi:hypothetical protein